MSYYRPILTTSPFHDNFSLWVFVFLCYNSLMVVSFKLFRDIHALTLFVTLVGFLPRKQPMCINICISLLKIHNTLSLNLNVAIGVLNNARSNEYHILRSNDHNFVLCYYAKGLCDYSVWRIIQSQQNSITIDMWTCNASTPVKTGEQNHPLNNASKHRQIKQWQMRLKEIHVCKSFKPVPDKSWRTCQ